MLEVKNQAEFEKKLRDFAAKTKQAPEVAAAKIMLNISRQTILLTRVDTGRLVAAWQISEGPRPSFGEINPDGEGSRQKAIDSSAEKISEYSGGTIWFANSVEYATHRENGTDTSPGDFMLKSAIMIAKQRMDKILKEVSSELF